MKNPLARRAATLVALVVAGMHLMSFHPARAALIGCTVDGSIFEVNTSTGAANLVSVTDISDFFGIAFQPGTGELFGFAWPPSLFKINPNPGTSTSIGSLGIPGVYGEGDLTFNPRTGGLYGGYYGVTGERRLFQIDPQTGTGTLLPSFATIGDYSAFTFDSDGTLFVIRSSFPNATLLTLDPDTGVILSSVTMDRQLGGGVGMAFDPATGIAYVAESDRIGAIATTPNLLYTLNTSTGSLTPVGELGPGIGLDGLAFSPDVVPEPTAVMLLGVTLLSATTIRRRI